MLSVGHAWMCGRSVWVLMRGQLGDEGLRLREGIGESIDHVRARLAEFVQDHEGTGPAWPMMAADRCRLRMSAVDMNAARSSSGAVTASVSPVHMAEVSRRAREWSRTRLSISFDVPK